MKIHLDLARHGRALIIIGATVGLLTLPTLTAAVIPVHWQTIGTAYAAKSGHGSGGKGSSSEATHDEGSSSEATHDEGGGDEGGSGGHKGGKGGSSGRGHSGNRGNGGHDSGMDKILHGPGSKEEHDEH